MNTIMYSNYTVKYIIQSLQILLLKAGTSYIKALIVGQEVKPSELKVCHAPGKCSTFQDSRTNRTCLAAYPTNCLFSPEKYHFRICNINNYVLFIFLDFLSVFYYLFQSFYHFFLLTSFPQFDLLSLFIRISTIGD